jgi:hypothetical protein
LSCATSKVLGCMHGAHLARCDCRTHRPLLICFFLEALSAAIRFDVLHGPHWTCTVVPFQLPGSCRSTGSMPLTESCRRTGSMPLTESCRSTGSISLTEFCRITGSMPSTKSAGGAHTCTFHLHSGCLFCADSPSDLLLCHPDMVGCVVQQAARMTWVRCAAS